MKQLYFANHISRSAVTIRKGMLHMFINENRNIVKGYGQRKCRKTASRRQLFYDPPGLLTDLILCDTNPVIHKPMLQINTSGIVSGKVTRKLLIRGGF